MTLKQLEVFLAVADSHSFSRGGEAVSLAQSTASQHVRALEEELGTRLFDRNVSQVSLTEAGRIFYDHARRICRACDKAKTALRRFQGLDEAILHVGASTTPASCMIPDMLGRFSSDYPGIRVELAQGDSRAMVRSVVDGDVELAVTGGRFDEEQVQYEQMGGERILLVGTAAMRTAKLTDAASLKKLPLIVREPGSGTRQAVDAALFKAGVPHGELKIVAQLGSSEAVRRAVLGGAGVAFISALAVARELEDGRLKEIRIPGIRIKRNFYLAIRRGRSLSPAAEVFVKALRQQWQKK